MSIYQKAVLRIPSKDIDHWQSDLYLRKTPQTDALIKEYEWNRNVKVFRDNIDHALWYEVPFAYDPFYEKKRNWRMNNMFNIEKYRMYDYLQIKGFFADVSTENEAGELIDRFSKDASWIKSKPVTLEASLAIAGQSAETYLLDFLNDCSDFSLKVNDLMICGDSVQFWNRENEEAYTDEKGKYFVLYGVGLYLNNVLIEEADLHELLPNLEY